VPPPASKRALPTTTKLTGGLSRVQKRQKPANAADTITTTNGTSTPVRAQTQRRSTTGCRDRRSTFDFCLDRGVVGVGWGVAGDPADFADYAQAANQRYGGVNPSVRALYRLPNGTAIWTYDAARHDFYLAEVISGWQHLSDAAAVHVDIRNVRPVHMFYVDKSQVPVAVRRAFSRGRTLQRVRSTDAALRSSQLVAAFSQSR
jgi:hypothetical protein